ncbi:hypothetical protein NFH98_11840 [Halomonas sp. H33-56]|uniref:hypothetical protein n=1 Tax=Halomonas sp. H33-56 TaxID=2950873 RepID=UPI0032DE7B35|nr:hypothetical protein [Gammaproteobacteria bacterium]
MGNSDYIAIGSVIVALAAFAVAIWQGFLTRKHNILSVKPRFYIDKSYVEGLHYRLESQGLGPGVIENFTILVNEEKIINPKSDPWPELFKKIGVTGVNYEFHIPSVGSTHSPNTSKILLSVTYADQGTPAEVMDVIDGRVNFMVEFKSLYEEQLFSYKGGENP